MLELPDTVTEIGTFAFSENQLTGVTISAGIELIPAGAFINNRLTTVTFPRSVTVIGERAFGFNTLTAVIIPGNIREIKKNAFVNNPVASITIGSEVLLHKTSFDNGFAAFYNRNGKKAGTYVLNNGAWSIG
jgi:hypothetical protein